MIATAQAVMTSGLTWLSWANHSGPSSFSLIAPWHSEQIDDPLTDPLPDILPDTAPDPSSDCHGMGMGVGPPDKAPDPDTAPDPSSDCHGMGMGVGTPGKAPDPCSFTS